MSDNKDQEIKTKFLESLPAKEVERNGTKLPVAVDTISRGAFAGYPHPTVEVTKDNLQTVIKFLGAGNVVKKLQAIVNQEGQASMLSAADIEEHVEQDEKGKEVTRGEIKSLDRKEMLETFASGKAGREATISEMEDEVKGLTSEMTKLVADLANPQKAKAAQARLVEVSEQINGLNIAIEEKRAVFEARAAKRKAAEAAKAAKEAEAAKKA